MENLIPRVKTALATLARQLKVLPKSDYRRKRKQRLHQRLTLLLGRLGTPNEQVQTEAHQQALKLLLRVEAAPRAAKPAAPVMQLHTDGLTSAQQAQVTLGAQMHQVFATTLRKRTVATAQGKAYAAFKAALACAVSQVYLAQLRKWQAHPVGQPPERPTHWHGLALKDWHIWANQLSSQFAAHYIAFAQAHPLLERPSADSRLRLVTQATVDGIRACNALNKLATFFVAANPDGTTGLYRFAA